MSEPDEYEIKENFKIPSDYDPPQRFDDQQKTTEYPNINVDQYRQKSHWEEIKILPSFQCLDRNSEGVIILGTNDYHGRVWNGTVFGFEHVTQKHPILDSKNAAFRAYIDSAVTDIKFVNDTTFLMGESDGRIILMSTRAPRRSQDTYCLFSIGKKTEHRSMVKCLDISRVQRDKGISGDEDGWLLAWDLAGSDLVSIRTIRLGHADAVNDISTFLDNDDCFVTVSDDKSVLSWDLRDERPSSALFESHKFQFKAVEHLNENQILVGDKGGVVYLLDVRQPRKFVVEKEVDDNSVHKIIVKG